ncbi:MAG: MMPL family transporter [Candidatus Abyssubacteria bacterium]
MSAYFRFVLRHRLVVVTIFAAVTALSLVSLSRGVVASSLNKLFFGEHPAYEAYLERLREFGTEEVNIFAFESSELLGEEEQARLRRVLDRIETIDDIGRVYSILDAQRIRGEDGTLYVSKYADEAIEDPEQIPVLLAALQDDSLAGGLVISSDGKSMAILPEIDAESQGDLPAERGPEIIGEILRIFEEEGFAASEIRRAGFLVAVSEVVEQTYYNLRTLFPFVVVILPLTVWLLFRRLWPALISLAASLLAVIWTMGFAVFLDREINVLMATVPAVIIIVSFSDVVHLCSAYLLELDGGMGKEQAVISSAEDVGKACFFTSLTTFVGFVCLSLIPTPMFRSLGVILGFGVASALLIAMTLVPIFFSFLPEPKRLRRGATSRIQGWLDRVLLAAERLATRRAWTVIMGSGLILVLALAGLTQLEIEADFAKRFQEDNRLRRDLSWFEEHFAGTTGLDIYVEVPEADGLFDPETFARIARFQDSLIALPRVDRAFSLVNLVREIHLALNEDADTVGPLPTTRQAMAQYLLLFELGGGEDLDRLVDFERRTMRITLRLNDEGFRASASVAKEAVALGGRILAGRATVEPSGLTFLLGDWLDEILSGQRKGVVLSWLTITAMMVWALRSFRAGLWAMTPNILPLLVLGGYVGAMWDYVDSDTLILGVMAIGIGVDDTIHFLVRYRIEEARSADPRTAIRRTLDFAGRAIIMTTLILVIGFSPFALSDYYTIRMMGTLLPLCLVVALLADLLLVPALVQVGLIRFGDSGTRG